MEKPSPLRKGANVKALLLAAGLGSRLAPYTDHWPKCLMPVSGRPLMEYWIKSLEDAGVTEVLVNTHHHADIVSEFLSAVDSAVNLSVVFEPVLLNTAGTIRENSLFFAGQAGLVIHADNWCQCDLKKFILYHRDSRPRYCNITMMTFDTDEPEKAGIVTLDNEGVVTAFYEKQSEPPGRLANAAVYLLEPEVIDAITQDETVTDISLDVITRCLGKISTWHNAQIHRDIGTIENLRKAQADVAPSFPSLVNAGWREKFEGTAIFRTVSEGL